jgi:hypothetical protein
MKHPFHTLYYTGLSVLISLLIFGGLLIYNLSNIVHLIPKEKTSIEHSDIVMNPIVLETSIPKSVVKVKLSKVETKVVTPKTKVIYDSLSKSTFTDSGIVREEIKIIDSTKTP